MIYTPMWILAKHRPGHTGHTCLTSERFKEKFTSKFIILTQGGQFKMQPCNHQHLPVHLVLKHIEYYLILIKLASSLSETQIYL